MLTRKTLLKIVAGQFLALSWCLGYIAAGGQIGPGTAMAVASHTRHNDAQIKTPTPVTASMKSARPSTPKVPSSTAALRAAPERWRDEPSLAAPQATAVYPPMKSPNTENNRWRTGNTAGFGDRKKRAFPESVNPWRRYGEQTYSAAQGAMEYPPLNEYFRARAVHDGTGSSNVKNRWGGYPPAAADAHIEQRNLLIPPGYRYR